MWLFYLAILAGVDTLIYQRSRPFPLYWYHVLNALPALLFLFIAYTPWLRNKWLTLFNILLIAAAPILVNNLLIFRFPPGPLSNVEGTVLRQLPVLFIALVLVAWHYNLASVLLFSFGSNLFELLLVIAFERFRGEQLYVFYFVSLVRTVSFILVGIFVNRLIHRLRVQQEELVLANRQLSHYSSTLENLTISRERNRMSRELHDTVVHTLSGLAVQLETAKAYKDVDPDAAAELVERSLQATRDGLHETRRALKDLRATPLEDLGLLLALRQLAENAAERGRLEFKLDLPKALPSLAPDVEQTLYRVAQEAVQNVVQHANARTLWLCLTADIDSLHLSVRDDGSGYRQDNSSLPGHYGINGMRERARLAGGYLTISSQPNQGTTVSLAIEGYTP